MTASMICNMTRLIITLLVLFAARVGAQTTWNSNGSASDTQAKINGAANGDTILLPLNGSFTWTTRVTFTKGITLNLNGSTITRDMPTTENNIIECNTVAGFTTRITNGTLAGGGTAPSGFYGVYIGANTTPATGFLRLDNLTFQPGGNVMLETFGGGKGLIDHCTFNITGVSEVIHSMAYGSNTNATNLGWTYTVVPGSDDALYIEDCTFNKNFGGASGALHCHAGFYGGRIVFRHNIVGPMDFDIHGKSTGVGPRWYEIYNNTWTNDGTASKTLQLRAGSGVIFNNVALNVPGASNSVIHLWEESPGTYPAPYQIGRGQLTLPSTFASDPMRIWNNTIVNQGGGTAGWSISLTPSSHIQEGRDYFLSARPGYVPLAYPHPMQGGAAPTVKYVDKNHGSAADTPGNGSESAPWLTIGYAISQISASNTILVKNGTYSESLINITGDSGTLASPTTLKAYPGHTPSITGPAGNFYILALTGVSHWLIEGLNISGGNHALLIRTGSNNITIRGNTLRDTSNQIVHVVGASHTVLFDANTFLNGGSAAAGTNGEALYIGTHNGSDNVHSVTIRGNVIDNMEHEAIDLKHDVHDCVIEDNIISNCVANFNFGKWSILVNPMVTWGSNPNHIIRRNIIFNQGGAGTGAAIGIWTGAQVYNNIIYSVTSPAYAFEIDSGDAYTRYVWHNTMDVPSARAINSLGGTSSIGNNIGPPTAGNNLAFNSAYFANAAANNYHLVAGSAPINAGGAPPFTISTDFDGNSRSSPDIGAFEFVGGGIVATPIITPAAGPYFGTQNVDLSCSTPGSVIHYTTDGSTPTTANAVFSAPIPLSAGATVKALAVASGLTDSAVATSVYEIGTWGSATTFKTFATPSHSALVEWSFRATPSVTNVDCVIGLAFDSVDAFTDIAAIVLFNASGAIQARNGSSYAADNVINYSAGTFYDFACTINVATNIYSVSVTPQGGSSVMLATGYAFRTEQQGITALENFGLRGAAGTTTVTNMSFSIPNPNSVQAINAGALITR